MIMGKNSTHRHLTREGSVKPIMVSLLKLYQMMRANNNPNNSEDSKKYLNLSKKLNLYIKLKKNFLTSNLKSR